MNKAIELQELSMMAVPPLKRITTIKIFLWQFEDIPSATLSDSPPTLTLTLSHSHSQLDSGILPNQGEICMII